MRRLKLICTITAVCALLSGCGMSGGIYDNYRAIEELRLIQTLGYDTARGGVTLSASSGKQGKDGDILLLRREGETILQAMDSLQDYTTEGELFFAHTRYLLVGRDAAGRGLGELLDFVERDEDVRLGTELFLLEDGAAADLIMGPGEGYDVTEVLISVKEDVERRAVSHVGNVRETAVALSEYGAAVVCLLRTVGTEGSVVLAEPGLSAIPVGYAVLKDGKLTATVTDEQAEALSLLLNYPGTVTRVFPDGSGGETALRFERADSSFTPSWEPDGSPGPVEVRLSVRAVVAESKGGAEAFDTDLLAALLRSSLEEDVRALLGLTQALDADFLSLGREMRISSGKNFAALPEDWLPALEFNVAVDAVIDHSYDLDTPLEMNGEART